MRSNLQMIRDQVAARGVKDHRILKALATIERAHFVPADLKHLAYEDKPIPLAHQATISQPYMVGVMTELLDPHPGHRVLEVGTGSGYQTAILSLLCSEVWSVEINADLVNYAWVKLSELGRHNVHILHRDGWAGLQEQAPFDRIMVTAAPPAIPDALKAQLGKGGKMVIPTGDPPNQVLLVVTRTNDGTFQQEEVMPVRFVPLVEG